MSLFFDAPCTRKGRGGRDKKINILGARENFSLRADWKLGKCLSNNIKWRPQRTSGLCTVGAQIYYM